MREGRASSPGTHEVLRALRAADRLARSSLEHPPIAGQHLRGPTGGHVTVPTATAARPPRTTRRDTASTARDPARSTSSPAAHARAHATRRAGPCRRQRLANSRRSHVRPLASRAPPANDGSSPAMQTSPLRDQLSQRTPAARHQVGARQSPPRRQAGSGRRSSVIPAPAPRDAVTARARAVHELLAGLRPGASTRGNGSRRSRRARVHG